MPQVCTTCVSPHVATIDALWATGTRTRKSLAGEFGVGYQSLVRHLRSHLGQVAPAPAQARATRVALRAATPVRATISAVETFEQAFGVAPMPYQVDVLTETSNMLLLKGRQIGATQAMAAAAIHCARSRDGALAAVISPSLRQSTEICTRARIGLWQLGEKLRQDSTSLLRLENGSRIISLPGSARGIRGYPVDFLVLDEAAWIDDETFTAARAMTAATGGRIVVQSTPGSPSGFFHSLATETPDAWRRMVVRSEEAATIDPEFLARERREMTPALYAAEYEAQFPSVESLVGAIFHPSDIARLFGDEEASCPQSLTA